MKRTTPAQRATKKSEQTQKAPTAGAVGAASSKRASKPALNTPDHVGWAAFNRGGKPIIEEVDVSGEPKTVGPSSLKPVLRLRAASRLPNTVAAVREEHNMLFDYYKANGRQVRTLVAMGVKVIIRSGKHAVVVERSPNFERELITKELQRRRSEAMVSMIHAMLPIIDIVRREANKRPAKTKSLKSIQAQQASDPVEDMKPYQSLAFAVQPLRGIMPTEILDLIDAFMADRANSAVNANLSRPSEGDLDRFEID